MLLPMFSSVYLLNRKLARICTWFAVESRKFAVINFLSVFFAPNSETVVCIVIYWYFEETQNRALKILGSGISFSSILWEKSTSLYFRVVVVWPERPRFPSFCVRDHKRWGVQRIVVGQIYCVQISTKILTLQQSNNKCLKAYRIRSGLAYRHFDLRFLSRS